MTTIATEPPVNPPELSHCPGCEKCVSEDVLADLLAELTEPKRINRAPRHMPEVPVAISEVVHRLIKLAERASHYHELAPYQERVEKIWQDLDQQQSLITALIRDWPLEICDTSEHVTCRDCAYEG